MVIHLLSQVMNIYFLFALRRGYSLSVGFWLYYQEVYIVSAIGFFFFFVGKLSSLLGLSLSLLILLEMHYAFSIWAFECFINSGKFSITIFIYCLSYIYSLLNTEDKWLKKKKNSNSLLTVQIKTRHQVSCRSSFQASSFRANFVTLNGKPMHGWV